MFKGAFKRINRELDNLMPWEYSKIDKNKIEVMVNNCLLYFVFPDTYPFKPPKIYIKKKNGTVKEYINSFTNFKINNNVFIKKKFNNDWCPCCDTITCEWSPKYTLHNIIYEFQYYENIKNTIINVYILNKCKLFIDNIEDHIISFLSPIFETYVILNH